MSAVTVTLSDQERDMLEEILTSYLGDLRMEVSATDSFDFRQMLKRKEEFLKDLLARL